MALDTTLDLDTEVLESLDFKVPCGHSQHGHSRMGYSHSGDAEFIAVAIHDCLVRPGAQGAKYPCCASWANFVQRNADSLWECPVCHEVALGGEMVAILGPLDTM